MMSLAGSLLFLCNYWPDRYNAMPVTTPSRAMAGSAMLRDAGYATGWLYDNAGYRAGWLKNAGCPVTAGSRVIPGDKDGRR